MNRFEEKLFEGLTLVSPGESNTPERDLYLNLVIEILFLYELEKYGNYLPEDVDKVKEKIEKRLETFYNVNLVDVYYKRDNKEAIEIAFFKARILFGTGAGDLPTTLVKYKHYYYPNYELLEQLMSKEYTYYLVYNNEDCETLMDVFKTKSYLDIKSVLDKYKKDKPESVYIRIPESKYKEKIKEIENKLKERNFELKILKKNL